MKKEIENNYETLKRELEQSNKKISELEDMNKYLVRLVKRDLINHEKRIKILERTGK